MSIIKYNSCSVVSVADATKGLDEQLGLKISSVVDKVDPKMVYSVVRGIEGDVFNENHDLWQWESELCKKRADQDIYTWQTWIGKPVCVQHQNRSPLDHFGKVLDAWPNHDEKAVYMLLATNSELNPRLAEGIRSGVINKVSMGCAVKYSNCTYCGAVAYTVNDYCEHLRYHKGRVLPINPGLKYCEVAKVGEGRIKVGEDCHDSTGLEMSWVVNPAFPGCVSVDVLNPNIEGNPAVSPSETKLDFSPTTQYDVLSRILSKSSDPYERKMANLFRKAASKGELSKEEHEALFAIMKVIGRW